ncbi:hypothetical protein [Cohnella hashimotonis]|uniref:Holin n=1 Tax=Cohnella hashimotonis TaxID=2826895 RepID=A0ABT6TPN9_9BACL|nr:hypothetical protein [Cohnella hashimotonis]MDI4648511.1 hypothetical protein [Cohnella hashimotonis]
MNTDTLFTWDSLGTLAGASLFTYLVVLYTKTFIDRWIINFSTDLYAVLVGWMILILVQISRGTSVMDWRLYIISGANALLVALAAGQMHNKALMPPGNKRLEVEAVTRQSNNRDEA